MANKIRELMYRYEHLIKEEGFSAFVETFISIFSKSK